MSQSEYLKNLPSDDEVPITNDFDFEASNKQFDMDKDFANNTSPAYRKENFFDNLEGNDYERHQRSFPVILRRAMLGRTYRRTDAETFGRSSLEQRNREYRQRNGYCADERTTSCVDPNGNRRYNRGGYSNPDSFF